MNPQNRRPRRFTTFLIVLIAANVTYAAETSVAKPFRGALVAAHNVTSGKLRQFQDAGYTSIVLIVDGTSSDEIESQIESAKLVKASPLELYYWIEVARCPPLADAHPEWMASLQTHDEWRRFFPNSPRPAADEVAKTYPWVPILSREPFTAQLSRIRKLLTDKPTAQGVFLNDLQGAPSACGCGSPLCRWTSDYGERRTTTPLADDAATLFVDAVQKTIPHSTVIPVWTTECEKHDGAKDGLCAGVGCYDGICWRAYTRQLMPLQQTSKTLAVLTPFRAFQRDLPIYGATAGWVKHAIHSFSEIPPRHGGEKIPASRLIAVLQGWEVTKAEIEAQVKVAQDVGVLGHIVAYEKIDQSWQPKVVRWR